MGQVTGPHLDELSGCAASRLAPNVLWAHNDSGDSARVFAITTQGQPIATVNLAHVPAVDFEDIALGPGPQVGTPYVYVGDIGNNDRDRQWVQLYRFAEPRLAADASTPSQHTQTVEVFSLRYPDGPQDAEALMVAPNGDVYVVTKRLTPNHIYRLKAPLVAGRTLTAEYQGDVAMGWITAGDISPDGRAILLRNPLMANLWPWPEGQTLAQALSQAPSRVPANLELQGEAICWGWQGRGYFTLSEGQRPWVNFYSPIAETAPKTP